MGLLTIFTHGLSLLIETLKFLYDWAKFLKKFTSIVHSNFIEAHYSINFLLLFHSRDLSLVHAPYVAVPHVAFLKINDFLKEIDKMPIKRRRQKRQENLHFENTLISYRKEKNFRYEYKKFRSTIMNSLLRLFPAHN